MTPPSTSLLLLLPPSLPAPSPARTCSAVGPTHAAVVPPASHNLRSPRPTAKAIISVTWICHKHRARCILAMHMSFRLRVCTSTKTSSTNQLVPGTQEALAHHQSLHFHMHPNTLCHGKGCALPCRSQRASMRYHNLQLVQKCDSLAAAHLLVEKVQIKLAARNHGDAELGAQGLVQRA